MNRKEIKSDKDIEEILSIAVSKSGGNDEQSLRARMFESAKELGLTPDEVIAAEEQWHRKTIERDQKAKYIQSTRASFIRNLFLYVVINGAFAAFGFMAGNAIGPALYSIIIWGVFLVMSSLKFITSFFPESAMFETSFSSWQKGQESKTFDDELEEKIERKVRRKLSEKFDDDDD